MHRNGVPGLPNINPHFPETVDGSQTIGTFQKIMNLGDSLRDGAEHNTAVGNRFVSGNGHFSF